MHRSIPEAGLVEKLRVFEGRGISPALPSGGWKWDRSSKGGFRLGTNEFIGVQEVSGKRHTNSLSWVHKQGLYC